jgi:LAO/AO transport system kinase
MAGSPPALDPDALASGIRAGDRAALGRGITLIESTQPAHRAAGERLLTLLAPHTGGAHRVAVTGPPGAGKSTLIEALGLHLVGAGQRVAVLAIDPSSQLTGGSILGDKTRMVELAKSHQAFIRPSPSRGTLGGVAQRTREALQLCEAAGYDVVLIETVGTGQSEAVAAGMVDTFLVLLLGGAGDQLQGIKRGVLELADVLAVNKADGPNRELAQQAAADHRAATHLLSPRDAGWRPPVLLVSARTREGLEELAGQLAAHRAHLEASGALGERRRAQRTGWLWERVGDLVREAFHTEERLRLLLVATEAEVAEGRLHPAEAARRLLGAFRQPAPEEEP